MSFGPGWLDWEPWGRWSSAASAPLTLRFPTPGAEVELFVRVQGHAAPSHPTATVRVSTADVQAVHTFQAGDEPVSLRLACRAEISPPVATSEPRLLRAGRYQGVLRVKLPDPADWEPLTLIVRGARLAHVIGKLVTPPTMIEAGVLSFPFELEHRDGAEPIMVEIHCERLSATTRLGILSVELECMQARSPALQVAHMEPSCSTWRPWWRSLLRPVCRRRRTRWPPTCRDPSRGPPPRTPSRPYGRAAAGGGCSG